MPDRFYRPIVGRHFARRRGEGNEKLSLLFTPPFKNPARDPGYTKGYPLGVSENGGQYALGAVLAAFAFAMQGDGRSGYELLSMLNPIHQSAGWMYRVTPESPLGFHKQGENLALDPCIPRGWPSFEITFRYRTARYEIAVEQPARRLPRTFLRSGSTTRMLTAGTSISCALDIRRRGAPCARRSRINVRFACRNASAPSPANRSPPMLLVNVPGLVTAYYALTPDPGDAPSASPSALRDIAARRSRRLQRGAHPGDHPGGLPFRRHAGIGGPLFLGMDTHALSEPALASALEVLAANGVETMVDQHGGYTPTPVISHAILTYNRGRRTGLATGS